MASLISQLERLLEVIGRPLGLSGRTLQVGASLGVALYPQDGADADTLLKHADVAMYAAKHRGKNNFQFFTPELNRVASERGADIALRLKTKAEAIRAAAIAELV